MRTTSAKRTLSPFFSCRLYTQWHYKILTYCTFPLLPSYNLLKNILIIQISLSIHHKIQTIDVQLLLWSVYCTVT